MLTLPVVVFLTFVASVLALSFYLGSKAKSAKGYYAAHGEIHWFVNGIAFAGDYLSAASFLGICGMIALYGYDGFLYSIGFLAGWVVAIFLIAEPIKRLGKFTFADALDSKFNSRSIKLSVAIGTLVISLAYLIPQMVGAGALIKPLLGIDDNDGILIVGVIVTIIVTTAGMVSTTWVQFIKGSLLVFLCFILVGLILNRGLSVHSLATVAIPTAVVPAPTPVPVADAAAAATAAATASAPGDSTQSTETPAAPVAPVAETPAAPVPSEVTDGPLAGKSYYSLRDGEKATGLYRVIALPSGKALAEVQTVTVSKDGKKTINGLGSGTPGKLASIGGIYSLPDGSEATGPVGPFGFLTTLQKATIIQSAKEVVKNFPNDGDETTIYYPKLTLGEKLMQPGIHPNFKGIHSPKLADKLDFISFMLALFAGTASLPHILIRYYTVKNAAAARKSTVVGITAIGIFYVLTLFLGLAAMSFGILDLTDAGGNKAAPLLAKSFSPLLFAFISAIAFTTVLGTVSGLILAGSGAVAHDLIENVFKVPMTDQQKVRAGKMAAVGLGVLAMVLGIAFKTINVSLMVAWAFNIAASANLPALLMLLFWKKTTKQGIAAAVTVGTISSLGWILISDKVVKEVFKAEPFSNLPMNYPALATVPLGFLVLIVVSLLTQPKEKAESAE